jgi:DNA-binding NarL/FixJ family response regulator
MSSDAVTGETESPRPGRRVFLVDDHPLVREWLAHLVGQHPELEVCGTSARAPDALEAVGRLRPDVAIVAISLAGSGGGLRLIEDIRRLSPSTIVLAFSMREEAACGARALRAGAHGYVVKGKATKCLIAAIWAVLNGELYFSDELKATKGSGPSENQPT